jgi:glutamate/tyrosine decarboxylase-like PLP-dependent enzyme
VILYRYRSLRRHQFSVFTKWSGGIYGSATLLGTKPGGAIAAAWTALNIIGEDGYMELAEKTMESTRSIIDAIDSIPELKLIGNPEMSLIAFTSDTHDIFEIGDELNLMGWSFGRLQNPNGIHLVVSQIHSVTICKEFICDLKEAVRKVKRFSISKMIHKIQVSSVKFISKFIPEGVLPKIQRKLPSPISNKRSAAMYGMMGVISGDDLDDIVKDILDELNNPEA